MYETSYTVDRALRRQAMLDWSIADPWMPAFAAVLVVAVLGLAFSSSARILFGIFLGIALTYIGWRLYALRTPRQFTARAVTVRLDDDSLAYSSAMHNSTVSWSSLSGVLVCRRCVFLSLDGAWLAVPRGALTGDSLAFILTMARSSGARIRGSEPSAAAETAR